MTTEQLEAIRKNEFAIYKSEVSSAVEPKLHILLVHLYIEHLLERFLAANLKKTDGLFGKNGLTFDKKVLLVEAMGGLNAQIGRRHQETERYPQQLRPHFQVQPDRK